MHKKQRRNPLHCFHLKSGEQGNLTRSSVSKYANPSNLGRSLLEGDRDHLLSQARSDLMKQELQVESLNNCISDLQQQAKTQRLELQDAKHGYVESRREQVRLQEELSMKEKVLRDAQIRSMHEMGEIKRAQEFRVDEVSAKIKRKSRDNSTAHFPHTANAGTDGQVVGSPRHVCNIRRRTREGPEPACVRTPYVAGVAHAGGEGRINVLPWFRLVDVAKTSSETHKEGEPGCPKRVSGRHVVRRRQAPPVPAQQPAVFRWQ